MGVECKEGAYGLRGHIPNFPELALVDLSHSDMVNYYTELAQPVASEYSFINLYSWRGYSNCSLSLLNGNLVVLVRPVGSLPFFVAPYGENQLKSTVLDMMNLLRDLGVEPKMARVPKQTAERLAESIPNLLIEEDRDNWDYVYLADDLINLSGRKYHKKRNNIKQFISAVSYEYLRLTPELIPDCIRLQKEWCNTRDCFSPDRESLTEEHKAIMDTFDNFEALGAVGGAILIDGCVEAFSVGERLNKDTFVIHFEKANPRYRGIYQAINREVCADICAGYTYVNREQDVGNPGLRQAKQSYYPHHMVEKYVLRAS